jgi:hypothetical protein
VDLSFAPTKIILIGIVVAIFVFAAGCSDSCLNGEDKNITVTVLENKDTQMNMGLTNHHNVTIKIVNIRNTPAKNVEIDTAFCNDFVPDFRKCVNRSFKIDNIPPNGAVQQFFEYDRTAIENSVDGKYMIQYKANSCLPFIEVDNKIFVSQR